MRLLRPGFVLGFGTGYVLGAKAGRARYQQIEALWQRVLKHFADNELDTDGSYDPMHDRFAVDAAELFTSAT